MASSVVEDFPPSTRAASRLIGGELLALAASSLLYPFGLDASRKRTARRAEQRTVVFVHGYLGNRSSFYPLAFFLRMLGIGPLLSFSYSAAQGIEGAAIELRNSLRHRVRGGRIDLVCHSLGGLIARTWLQLLGGARRVDRCILLGTPDRGTYNAYWLLSRIGREVRPDSPLIRRLDASRAAASSVRFSSIVAGSDNIVIPRVFSAAEGEVIHLPDVGHMGLLFSPAVFRAVHQRLLLASGRPED
ncbi:MAG: alpha/beta fold hydrolase [Deltaproteobacteria bacterium]|nr:MAG: alpha/beta fold hydrolase [Deltaproteobacteria bacterium]TMB33328.1 MAG: alpha/beta fold hydrolase [Deltaproteobacteria bacterium]